MPAAGKQHVEADKRISLRDAVFIIKSGLPLFDATTEHGRLARRKDYKEYIAPNEQGRWKEIMQEKGSKYTAVATDRGVMLFSQTRIGEKALHTYLQECADNYFHPMKSTGMLRIYEVSSPTADVAAKADNYIDRLSRRDQRSDSAGLRYSRYGTDPDKMLSADVLIGAVCTEKYDMRPDFHDFDRFTGDNALKTDRKNYEIATLLYIAENGFADHLAADYFHPFDRMADFRPLAEKLGDTMRAKSENPQSEHDFGYAALQQEAKALARDMLESDYHIRDGEFALGQSAGKMLPSVPALRQQPVLRPAEAPAPTNRPTMKPSGTVAQQPVRRVPSVKSSRGKGHSVS